MLVEKVARPKSKDPTKKSRDHALFAAVQEQLLYVGSCSVGFIKNFC